MECYSCSAISAFHFVINRRIDSPPESNEKVLSMCCRQDLMRDIDGSPMNFPASSLAQTPEETLEQFIAMRTNAIAKGKWGGVEAVAADSKFSCYQCKEWRKANWTFSPFIKYINLSIYPSPCQCRCTYCGVHSANYDMKAPYVASNYEKIFEVLELARKKNLIAPRGISTWQVSSGEITIHPFKKQIMDLVHGEKVCFFTNGFIFDEDIARELHDNPLASINLSIDSGTPETWHKVKGVDNFEKVLKNLTLYRKYSNRLGQITIKYIILPQVNDFIEDFLSCINILKLLDVNHFTISRDVRVSNNLKIREKASKNEILDKSVENSAAIFRVFCLLNKINMIIGGAYTKKESESIINLSQELLRMFSRLLPR